MSTTNKALKTTRALEILQDSLVTGNNIEITSFKVSSTKGAFTPERTIADMNTTWYTGIFATAPLANSVQLKLAIVVPQDLELTTEESMNEFYIIGNYQGEEFLFGLLQMDTMEDLPYISSSNHYFTPIFNLVPYGGDVNIIVNSEVLNFQVTLPAENWVGSEAPYTQEVDLLGILSTDNPILGLLQSPLYDTAKLERKECAKIFRAVTFPNAISFYAEKEPIMDLHLQVKVVR